MNEEGGDGETTCSETLSLLSYTIRYGQFHRGRSRLGGCVVRTDTPVYIHEGGGGRTGSF